MPASTSVLTRRFACALFITALVTGFGWVRPAVAAAASGTASGPTSPQSRSPDDPHWTWPLQPVPVIVAGFDPPAQRWSAGHRGIDLAGSVGQAVRAVDDGVVTFAGPIAGRGVVVVSHGLVRSTYEPVSAAVSIGDVVRAGSTIGVLQAVRSHCLPQACLHLGARQGDHYFDPQTLLGHASIRLKPLRGLTPLSARPSTGGGPWVAAVGAGAPVTSGFGLRIHPLTGQRSFHDGVDYGVGCGTPIMAATAGTVTLAGADPVYGHQIVVEHADGLETRYGHMYADGLLAKVGDRVQAGQVIGAVGSDGASTGCHLHFIVARHGQPVDPSLVDPL